MRACERNQEVIGYMNPAQKRNMTIKTLLVRYRDAHSDSLTLILPNSSTFR